MVASPALELLDQQFGMGELAWNSPAGTLQIRVSSSLTASDSNMTVCWCGLTNESPK